MHRRSRHQLPLRALAFVAVLVVGALAVKFWPDSGEGDPDPSGPRESAVTSNAGPGSDGGDLDLAGNRAGNDDGDATPAAPPPVVDPPRARPQPTVTPPATPRAPAVETPAPVAGTSDPDAAPDFEPVTNPPPSRRTETADGRRARRAMALGFDLLAQNQPVEARRVLSQALLSDELDPDEAAAIRSRLTEVNQTLVFSPAALPDDRFSIVYQVQDNDALSKLPRKVGVLTDWRLIQMVNGLARPESIRSGQRLKLCTGPFHAVVSKHDYRMDIYMGEESERVYVISFPVGLGEYNSTPVGRFRIRRNSKLVNPTWRNPRTGERFAADDPKNPIGERWIGLIGDEPHLANVAGYGIHGTIEPESIGRDASMGCIRMRPDDVAMVYAMLITDASTVEIRE